MALPSSSPRTLHLLTGPTAVGKTELALRWAEHATAEIVSCDSLLFYRGMDIGTAKPTPAERARVPHHLIDVAEVTAPMDVVRYVTLARAAFEEIAARGRPILVTGGSGFYLKAFFAPVADDIQVPAALRAEVAALWEAHGLEAVLRELHALNPGGLGRLDTTNPRRVIRALERCRASGRPLVELAAAFAARPAPFADWNVRLCRLDRPIEVLEKRIAERVDAMLQAGLVEEVARLLTAGLKLNPSAAKAIGYRETIEVLEGRRPRAALADEIRQHTRALVRKQRTWFRTQLPPHEPQAAETATAETLFR